MYQRSDEMAPAFNTTHHSSDLHERHLGLDGDGSPWCEDGQHVGLVAAQQLRVQRRADWLRRGGGRVGALTRGRCRQLGGIQWRKTGFSWGLGPVCFGFGGKLTLSQISSCPYTLEI